jgi:hypothetical protein
MEILLLVESFELGPSSIHFGEGNSYLFPFCENVFVSGKSPVKVQPEILYTFLGELHAVYMDREAGFASCSEYDVARPGSSDS